MDLFINIWGRQFEIFPGGKGESLGLLLANGTSVWKAGLGQKKETADFTCQNKGHKHIVKFSVGGKNGRKMTQGKGTHIIFN